MDENQNNEKIIPVNIENQMKSAYIDYSRAQAGASQNFVWYARFGNTFKQTI